MSNDVNHATAANPYAAPSSDLNVPPAADELQLASRWRRLSGAIIDSIIMTVVTVPMLIMFMGGWKAYAKTAAEHPVALGLGAALLWIAMFLLINGYFLAKDGQTIAKKILGTQIVRSDGSKADFTRIVTRRMLPVMAVSSVPTVGPFLSLLDPLFIFRNSKKCLHDDIADTVVIRIY